MTLEEIVERFRHRGFEVVRQGGGYRLECPAHPGEGKGHNLELKDRPGGGVEAHCYSHDCELPLIAESVGLKVSDFYSPAQPNGGKGLGEPEAAYPYRDEQGRTLFWVGRFAGKEFRQWKPGPEGQRSWGIGGIRRVLFGLPELLETAPGDLIGIVEGEKDAVNLAAAEVPATTCPMGAGKWRQEYTDWLKLHLADRRFLILPDNDPQGTSHAEEVYESLKRAGLDVAVLTLPDLPPKGDVTDWLRAGGTGAKLRELAEPAPHPLILRLLSRAQLRELPPPSWQIEGLFYEQSIVEIYSESNVGKSLIAMDIGLNMVRGTAWAERNIVVPGSVLYVNADGGPGFSPRLIAWELANGNDALFEFWTYPMELMIADAKQMTEFTAGLSYLPDVPAMIVIDTLSQCIPGVNENQQEDMTRVIAHLNAIKRRYKTTIVLLHHVGKDGLNRGSTVIPGAADTIIRVTQQPGALIELRCDKQRDGRKFDPIYFQIVPHNEQDGVFLSHTTAPAFGLASREEREQQVLDALRINAGWLTREEVKMRTVGIGTASVYRYLKKLVDEGLVLEEDRVSAAGHLCKTYLYLPPKEGVSN